MSIEPLKIIPVVLSTIILMFASACDKHSGSSGNSTLLELQTELRLLEKPVNDAGVPDYSPARMSKAHSRLQELQLSLTRLDTSGWPVRQRVDYMMLWAEMNGFDFQIRVLKPWARDPVFYALAWTDQSDTPDHEGPTSHAAIELWKYSFPLSDENAAKLAVELEIIPSLLVQARTNLTGNARDLWIAGAKSIREQISDLDGLAEKTSGSNDALKRAIENAKVAFTSFAQWLEEQAPTKTGPSGIGKHQYNWHLRNVLLVPMSWEDEVRLLKRELDRSYSMLALERHRNRHLPQIVPAGNTQEYTQRADASIKKMMAFLSERKIMTVKAYMEPELRKHLGRFTPEDRRNFFAKILHLEPAVLYSHLIHWFEVAALTADPHANPIRRTPTPFNIWMTRSEGLATGMEEMLMHAGLYDDNPRARELVWIMLAQRCARGLASLYAHANEITLEEARKYQIEWTPKGWMRADLGLVGAEQQLYLRMPAYGTSYVTGKYLIERLLMDVSRQKGADFELRAFMDDMFDVGIIPLSLIRWQLTGMDDEIAILQKATGIRQ